jgi:flagellar biosynthesis/type III secretory pathway chaperone
MTMDARRRLHTLLEDRIDLLRKVENVSRRRAEAIAAGRTDAIARLVAEREPLVASLVESSADVESLAAAVAGTADPDLLALVEKASSLVDAIAELDRIDEAAITASGADTRRELEKVSNAGRANRAYQGGRPSSGNRMERSA